MAVYQCNTCQSLYKDVLDDGMLYFHACAPITDPVTGLTTERPDKRDENVQGGEGRNKHGYTRRGKGSTLMPVQE